MKTYDDLYTEYKDFITANPDISEDEYNGIMQQKVNLIDILNKLVEYVRFVKFTGE